MTEVVVGDVTVRIVEAEALIPFALEHFMV